MHSFQFHLGDYYSHTSHLSLTEDLAYRRIIDFYYLHETAPTGRPDQIARLIRMPKEVTAVEQVLNEFFCQEVSDSVDNQVIVWRHKRCDVEIEKYQSFKESGKRGAAMRWAKGGDGEAMGGLSGGYENPNSNHKPVTINHKPIKERAARGTRLPTDCELSQDWFEFCKQQRPDLKPQEVFAAFRDYWIAQPGQKGSKTDWTATWRNWVRNQKAVTSNAWLERKERGDAALRVMTGQQRSINGGDYIDVIEDKDDPFRLSFGGKTV